MVEFNKLFIIPCNKGIYIDCSILNMPYFKDVYIDKIIIDNQDTFKNGGVSKNSIYSYTIDGNHKEVQISIKDTELLVPTIKGNMFFVYIITKGTCTPDTPCGLDNDTTIGVVVDTYFIYRVGLKYIKEAYNKCDIPRAFIDYILRYKAFQACLDAKEYPLAITYWKKFISSINNKLRNECGCVR